MSDVFNPSTLGVDHNGSVVAAEQAINFIDGANTTITVTDNPSHNRVDVTIASSGGSSGITFTDGVHTVTGSTQLTVTGGTIGGTTPNATLTITGGVSSVSNSDGTLTISPTTGAVVASLAALASASILVGNGSNIATGVAVSGDLTLVNTGAFTVAKIQGTVVSGTTGSTNVVFSNAPTLVNPIVGTQSASDNSDLGASTKYVTTAITNAIAGVNPAVAVQAATTAAADTSSYAYSNGASGVGATLTGPNNTALTVDGFTFTLVNQRILVKNDTQTTGGASAGAFNGVYYVSALQTAISGVILIRALDYDQPSDINNTGAIPVVNGTVNGTTSWVLTSQVTTVGTDALTYTKFSLNPTTIQTTTLTNTHIWVGNSSNIATDVAAGGDVTLANTGVFTIANNAITTVKIIANAITFPKIQTSTANSLLGFDGSGNASDITLTTTGSSGAATISGGVLNIPQYSGGGSGISMGLAYATASGNFIF